MWGPLIYALLGLAIVAAAFLFVRRSQAKEVVPVADDDDKENGAAADEVNPRQAGDQGHTDDEDGEEGNEGLKNFMYDENGKKLGVKKARKLQEKEERRRRNEEMAQAREQAKLLQHQEEEERKEREAEEAEDERQREAELEREREAQRQKELEEYNSLKSMFVVEESGELDVDHEAQAQSLLNEFVSFIKEKKVVQLEDLAAHFGLKTQDTIERIQQLEAEGRLTGLTDDRGKYIFISEEELSEVVKFIERRGRITIAELMDNSNRLISLSETDVEFPGDEPAPADVDETTTA
ncbi:uncharacterized protein MONBRDRAFT_22450 [Monosiga brevicollis MX1]|uniref:DDRGK domain-containing protein 1 n=1 Tax=Monosiga brevicollis TaxID=81824 RepID=DDRGK_MONBE|nr:uncharacterized protein MONBRDRAFT_22450 [Monosiga brevicollis MX1]A9UQM0.1 RecName: Full=DDRGK domain-containing protein 1; Flags: Precursor [Monosiga brevicollis]EDQ93068.1 predicted protein [Monosiga brevicollis MX1]|eukprot:XP_001742830.1 hypothetical protein [Monosiga brevicollis MX1]